MFRQTMYKVEVSNDCTNEFKGYLLNKKIYFKRSQIYQRTKFDILISTLHNFIVVNKWVDKFAY